MAVGPNRSGIATDLLRHNYRQHSTLYRATTKTNKTLIAAHQRPPHHHAPMTGRSSLLAAVIPIPTVGRRSVMTGPDGHAPAQVTTSSPTTHTENICKIIVVAQSDGADRPLSARTRRPRVIPILFVDQLSISGKRWIRVVEKTTVYWSSAVSSAQAFPTHAVSARHQRPADPCPNTPRQPSRRHRIQPQPGRRRTHLASPPAPAPSQFQRSMASPQPCAAGVAVQLRNTATPPTNTGPQRLPLASDLRK